MSSKNASIQYWDLQQEILEKIQANGGWVNCHAHIDRAYTITQENFALSNKMRHEKWKLNDELRRNSTVEQIYDRMARAVERLLSQGVTALGTFIDVDCNIKDKAIKAAIKVRDEYKDQILIKYLNQSSYGLLDDSKQTLKWFEEAVSFVDIIGGLLKADKDREEEHLDILFNAARVSGKMVHIHLDELNIPQEKETELVVKKIKEYELQGKVVGIHGISLNCHPIEYRKKIYKEMANVGMMYVACPVSWLNSRRSEEPSPIHNPITPFDEMNTFGIPVGLGSDNIADIWMPFNNADMWLDLRVLIEASRCHDLDEIVNIATKNGRKVLGLS
jgi:cytosine/adenosine deaminase-related metal-dependent hydrolase